MGWTNKTENFVGDAEAKRTFEQISEKTGGAGHATISFAPGEKAKVFSGSGVEDGGMVREEVPFTTLQELAEKIRLLQVERGASIAGTDIRAVERIAELDHTQKRYTNNGLPVPEALEHEIKDLVDALQDEGIRTAVQKCVSEGIDTEIRVLLAMCGKKDKGEDAVRVVPKKQANHELPGTGQKKDQFGKDKREQKNPNKTDTESKKPESPPPVTEAPQESHEGADALVQVPYHPDIEVYMEALAKEAESMGEIIITPEGGAQKSGTKMAEYLRGKIGVFRNKVEAEDTMRGLRALDAAVVAQDMKEWLTEKVKNMPISKEVKERIVKASIETAQSHARAQVPKKQNEQVNLPAAQDSRDTQVELAPLEKNNVEPLKVTPETREHLGREIRESVKEGRERLEAMNQFLLDYVEFKESEGTALGVIAKLFDKKPDVREALEREGNALLAQADAFVRESGARMQGIQKEVEGMNEGDAEAYARLATLLVEIQGRTHRMITTVLEEHRDGDVKSDVDSALVKGIKHAMNNPIVVTPMTLLEKEDASSPSMALETHQEADERIARAIGMQTEKQEGTHIPIMQDEEPPLDETTELVEALLREQFAGNVPDSLSSKEGVSEIIEGAKDNVPSGAVGEPTSSSKVETVGEIPVYSGEEGVRAIRQEYLTVVGEKKGWEGILALIAYLETRDTVPSTSRGVVDAGGVVRAIEVLTMAMPTERDGTPREKVLVSPESPMYRTFIKAVPRGGLREIVLALVEGKQVKDSIESVTQKDAGMEGGAPDDEDKKKESAEHVAKAEEGKSEHQDESVEAPVAPPLTPKVLEEFEKSFNITQETLEAIPGFRELGEDKQLLLLHTLRSTALLKVKSESVRGHDESVLQASTFMKKMWLGLTKAHQLNKRKKAITEEIFRGSTDEQEVLVQEKTLTSLTELIAQGPSVKALEGGTFEFSYVDERDFSPKNSAGEARSLTPYEKQIVARFNEASRAFGSLPSTLNMDAPWEREIYEKAKAEYAEARAQMLQLKEVCDGTEKMLVLGNEIDRVVMLGQYLEGCPDVEAELLRIKNESVLKQTITHWIASRGGYMALGAGVRGVTTAVLAGAGATLAGMGGFIAAPVAGSVVGGIRARGMAKDTLSEQEVRARTGGEWNTAEHAEARAHRKQEHDEARNIVKSSYLVERIDRLIADIEGEQDEAKREKLLGKLRARIYYTQEKSMTNEVDFGSSAQQAASRLDVLQAIARAQVVEGLSEISGRVQQDFKNKETGEIAKKREPISLEDRLSRFLGEREKLIDARQQKFVNRRMWKGVRMGAIYALVGAGIGRAVQEWTASGSVTCPPEGVKGGGVVRGEDTMRVQEVDVPKDALARETTPDLAPDGALESTIEDEILASPEAPVGIEEEPALPDDDYAVETPVVRLTPEHTHVEPTPGASRTVESLAPAEPAPPNGEGEVVHDAPTSSQEVLQGETGQRATPETVSVPHEGSAVERAGITTQPFERSLSGEPLTLTYTYKSGDGVERALQDMLKNHPRIAAHEPNLTLEEIRNIASRIRIGIQNDPEMARAFGVRNGNWNDVPLTTPDGKPFTVEVKIPADVVKEAIERFHPPTPQAEVVVPTVSPVETPTPATGGVSVQTEVPEASPAEAVSTPTVPAPQVPETPALPAVPESVASSPEYVKIANDLEQVTKTLEEFKHDADADAARVAEMMEKHYAQMVALQARIEAIGQPVPGKGVNMSADKLFSGMSTRLEHFSPKQVASSIGEVRDLLAQLESPDSIDEGAHEVVRRVLRVEGLLEGYALDHVRALCDMPEVFERITLKDLFDDTKGLILHVGDGKEVALREKTETMLIDIVYRLRQEGGPAVDAIVTRLRNEGGTMLDLIKQVSPLLPHRLRV